MSAADAPSADAATTAATPEERARALLEQAEAGLAAGALDRSEALLGEMADILASTENRSTLIGQALWMAAMVSLARGRMDEFARTSLSAIEGFSLTGDTQTANALRFARTELLQRVDHERSVRETGASGLLDVLAEQTEHLLARARGELPWSLVDRDREQLAGLVSLAADDAEGVQPLARLLRSLELDSVEAMIVAVLAPLGMDPAQAHAARALAGDPEDAPGVATGFLASLLFAGKAAQAAVIDALAPGAPLQRYRVVRVCQPGSPQSQRVELEPAILWFLRATPLPHTPLPAGVSAYQPSEFDLDIAPPLLDLVETLTRALAAPRSSLLVLAGRPGTGKLTATLAAAAHAGRPVIAVDADQLTEAQLARALPQAVRDAFCHGAALLVRWQWPEAHSELPAPVRAVMGEPGLRLCLATTVGHARMALTLARQQRADVLLLETPAVGEEEQHLAWRDSLTALGLGGLGVPESDLSERIQARLCRPGLAIGDIAETVIEAMARADASGQPVTVTGLQRCLDSRLGRELARYTEVLAGPSGPMSWLADAPAIEDTLTDMTAAILGGQQHYDEMGLHIESSTRPERIAGQLTGGTVRLRQAVAGELAKRVEAPVARIDIRDLLLVSADSALARLADAVAAAGRAGAVLLLEHADALIGATDGRLPAGLGQLLSRRTATVLLGMDRAQDIPLAVASHLDDHWLIDLGEVQ